MHSYFALEVMILIATLFTMIILLFKSRCIQVGCDQKQQFEPLYLAKMINRIVSKFDFDLLKEKRTYEQTKVHMTKRRFRTEIEGVDIWCKLNEEVYDSLFR